MTRLRRFAPTAPAVWPWNGWPNAGGIAGRMLVEQVAKWRGMRTQGQVLALAGLWESWRAPDGGLLRTCCILTTAANARVAPVHERMPLILAPRSWATWLGGPVAAAQALLVPAPAEALRCWPVSHRVNRVAEDGADLMAPVAAG